MDPEQTFLRVHARLSGMLSQLLTPKIRLAVEYVYLTVATTLLVLLIVMHTNFVQQPGCSNELSGAELTDAQLVQIKISSTGLWTRNVDDQNVVDIQKQAIPAEDSKVIDVNLAGFTIFTSKFWTNWIGSGARRSKPIFKLWKSEKEIFEPQTENAAVVSNSKTARDEAAVKTGKEVLHTHRPASFKETLHATIISFCTSGQKHLSSFWQIAIKSTRGVRESWNIAGWTVFLDFFQIFKKLHMEYHDSLIVHWLDKRSKAFEPTYLYTFEKGFFLLPEAAKSQHHIQTVNITISAQNSCFGNRWQQLLINSFVGYDTILMNSLLNSPGKGYLYNFQTNELYYLSDGHEPSEGPSRFGDYIATKFGVLIMSLFVFFTTTMSVSFTLRETQSRMLRFTVQLQHHARHQLPTFQLIFVHVIESLVFVPIMIGILFFLFEFYDDQLLAFLVLTLVWLCELFTMISVRTSISMQFFPRFFLLYFLVFHIYFFCYPYGFSYLAFSATAAFMQHMILYFWNRFEVPALQRIMRNRGLHHQAAVQITSSTIYTSTLHIAQVNVRDTDPANSVNGTLVEEAASNNSDPVNDNAQFVDLNPQQTGTAPGPGFLNPFASLLLWIVGGGGTSDGIVSLFSMFRDVREDRDQGQAYEEPQRHEEESTAL